MSVPSGYGLLLWPTIRQILGEDQFEMKSMTAFARASGETDACSWIWEIKSVNSKGLDIRFRMPPGFDALDIAVREHTAKALKRGNLFIALTLKWREDAASVRINEGLVAKLSSLAPKLGETFPDAAPLTMDGLLGIRGVIEIVDAGDSPEVMEALNKPLLTGFDEALAKMIAMRGDEGARMQEVLNGQLAEIEGLWQQAMDLAATQPAALKERLTNQLADVMDPAKGLTEDRLAQEVALLVTKADIREELDRLKAHVAAARDLMAETGPVGRKLDFLCQEFNREANTLCSKSSDVALTGVGLNLKAVIEQFREQVQNIE